MNTIFFIICTLSLVVLCFTNPQSVASILVVCGEKALTLSIKLLVVYVFWLGIIKIAENGKLTDKIASSLHPIIKLVFGKISPIAERHLSLNLSSNLLGVGGIATPAGIATVKQLSKDGNVFASSMLLVVTATGLQLLPTSVLSLRASFNSKAVNSILLPTILSTVISTAFGILLTTIFLGRKKK